MTINNIQCNFELNVTSKRESPVIDRYIKAFAIFLEKDKKQENERKDV